MIYVYKFECSNLDQFIRDTGGAVLLTHTDDMFSYGFVDTADNVRIFDVVDANHTTVDNILNELVGMPLWYEGAWLLPDDIRNNVETFLENYPDDVYIYNIVDDDEEGCNVTYFFRENHELVMRRMYCYCLGSRAPDFLSGGTGTNVCDGTSPGATTAFCPDLTHP